MVVIHRANGFRFVIYTQDHEPADVHVTGPGQAKIDLGTGDGIVRLVFSVGIKHYEMRRLLSEASLHREAFLSEWRRIHGERH